jgi:hypothetical protein
MKGIYLTEQAKQEIEAKLNSIEPDWFKRTFEDNFKFNLLNEILLSAKILPIEFTSEDVGQTSQEISIPKQ